MYSSPPEEVHFRKFRKHSRKKISEKGLRRMKTPNRGKKKIILWGNIQ